MSTQIISPEERPKKRWWLVLGGSTLWVSILVHVLFGAAAAYIVVQHFSKKHVNFVATPPPATQSEVEHKVELAKKNNVESAPPDLKRITTTDVSPISLPDVPVSPATEETAPAPMAGTGDVGDGLGGGNGNGGGDGSGSPFGSFDSATPILQGYLYDLKQTYDGKPTGMTPKTYHQVLSQFVASGWAPHILENYYKSKKALNTSSIFVPIIHAADGPKAFGVENEVAPNMYVIWYKVVASPPEDGEYRFVGLADDILAVRVNGETVLDASLYAIKTSLWNDEKRSPFLNFKVTNKSQSAGLFVGRSVHLTAGTPVEIDVLIGEEPGGWSEYFLYVERDDATYTKQANGSPLWPVFQLGSTEIHLQSDSASYPPFSHQAAPWQAAKSDVLR